MLGGARSNNMVLTPLVRHQNDDLEIIRILHKKLKRSLRHNNSQEFRINHTISQDKAARNLQEETKMVEIWLWNYGDNMTR